MNQNKRENYTFSRFSDNQKVYLISIRQEKIIPAHGAKFHFKHPHFQTRLTESWWHLLTGAYFLFEYNTSEKHHQIHKLILRKGKDGIYEEHKLIEEIPSWLYALISALPEFNEEFFNEKHSVYTTSRP